MRNILLTISYDGTDFCGWQRQDDENGGEANRTVQGEIEKALQKFKINDLKQLTKEQASRIIKQLSRAKDETEE